MMKSIGKDLRIGKLINDPDPMCPNCGWYLCECIFDGTNIWECLNCSAMFERNKSDKS